MHNSIKYLLNLVLSRTVYAFNYLSSIPYGCACMRACVHASVRAWVGMWECACVRAIQIIRFADWLKNYCLS